jgi:hypothetical protein
LGQKAKYSLRADVFRFAPESRHYAMRLACPKSADIVAKVGYGGWMPVSHSTIDDRL